jgi:Leucine-rich repeat (LRR) protein
VGTVPTSKLFDSLPKLEKMYLYSNEITFPFDGIDKAPNLKTLVLDSIAATLLDGVGAARSVVNLNVASNRLTSLPEELSNSISRKELNVRENQISGPIPTWLNELLSLTVLKASKISLAALSTILLA